MHIHEVSNFEVAALGYVHMKSVSHSFEWEVQIQTRYAEV